MTADNEQQQTTTLFWRIRKMSEQRNQIDRDTFLDVYFRMAQRGATALDIANALGVVQEADEKHTAEEKMSAFVSQKASNYRTVLKNAALEVAKEQGLDSDATKALVKSYTDRLPKLKHRNRASSNLLGFLDDLAVKVQAELAACDADPEDVSETPE